MFLHYLKSNRFNLYTDHKALKYVFNKKDLHGRIARWFTLLAEYDFEICYRTGRANACHDFLSRLAELIVIDENQRFEANLKAIAHYLDNLLAMDESISIMPVLKKKAKDFLVHDERLLRRTKCGIRFVPPIEMRGSILKGLHDEVGHWDFNSTYSFLQDRLWWPNMRHEVASFVKSCDIWQKTKPANRKEFSSRIPIRGLFHTWCIDFAGPLPRTNAGINT